MKKIFFAGLVTGLIVVGASWSVHATPVTQTFGVFDVTFYNANDTNGIVTGGANWTTAQINDVEASLQSWNRILNTPGRNIQVDMIWGELDNYGTNVLGGSSSVRVSNGSTIWNAGEYVWKEGQSISTPLDTMIQFDITAADNAWNFGQGKANAGEIDFRSVTTHEIGHSLGWSSSYDYLYDDFGWFADGFFDDGFGGLTAWDTNLVDGEGNRPESASEGTPGDFNEEGSVYFDGTNAVALFGGPVPIFAPDTFQQGSSLSHLDETTFQNYMMSPSISLGQTIREISELEWAMMADMGWDIAKSAPVPEPTTILLFVTGLAGLIGFRTRNKRK